MQDVSAEGIPRQQPVLMVEVENITHDKFKQTEEVKVKLK
jgi:hypothetical protein